MSPADSKSLPDLLRMYANLSEAEREIHRLAVAQLIAQELGEIKTVLATVAERVGAGDRPAKAAKRR